uniref:BUD13 homolog n=1 Tax=Cyprinus carpio TaxID=7962 RepID=A0A8C2I6S2_CYPCA
MPTSMGLSKSAALSKADYLKRYLSKVIDERPDEIKQLEAFGTGRWIVIPEKPRILGHRVRHESPETSPVQRVRHVSPDLSPQRRGRHDSPDLSPQRHSAENKNRRHDSLSPSPPRKSHKSSPSSTQRLHDKGCPHRRKTKAVRKGKCSDSDQSHPRRRPHGRRGSNSDLSPPRKRGQSGRGSDSDLSPPRKKPQRGRVPPRRTRSPDGQATPRMLSGGAAWLVSIDILRKEQEEICEREKRNQPLEEASRNAETIFRDKSERKHHLESERAELILITIICVLMYVFQEKPCYKGPPPPPNYVRGFDDRIADKKAVQEMAYKWSVEDM